MAISIRFRVDFDGACSVGFGKIALLEGIARLGSLSQAAREMGMSYRRAWMLIDSLNKSFDAPVVTMSIGGKTGGGATITDFGQQLIATLRALESKLTAPAQKHLSKIAGHVVQRGPKPPKRKAASRSIPRKAKASRTIKSN